MNTSTFGIGCIGLVVAAAIQGCSSDAPDDRRPSADSAFDASPETTARYGIRRWTTRGDDQHVVISAFDARGAIVEQFDSVVRPAGDDFQGTMTAMSGGSADLRYVLRQNGRIEVAENDLGKVDRIRGIAGRFAVDVRGVSVSGTELSTQSRPSSLHVLGGLTDGSQRLVGAPESLVCKVIAVIAACTFAIGGDGDEGPMPIDPTGGGTTTSSCPAPPC